MAGQIQNQKKMLRELSERLIQAEINHNDPDGLKPYYLFRMNLSNEIMVHLIGYYFPMYVNEHGQRVLDQKPHRLNLETKSISQIRKSLAEDVEERATNKITIPLLGSKSLFEDDNWTVEPEIKRSTQSHTIMGSKVEGEVYLDSVWLQDYNPEVALYLLMKNKLNNITKIQKFLDNMNDKYSIMEKTYTKIKSDNKGVINE